MTRLLQSDPAARSAPPPGMREHVMRAGMRRRRIAYAGAGSFLAAVAIGVAGLLVGSTATTDSLRIDQPATRDGRAVTAPAALPEAAARTTSGAVGPREQAPAVGGQPQQAASAPQPSARPSASPAGRNRGTHGQVTRSDREFGQLCPGDAMGVGSGGVSSSGWCVMVAPPESRAATPNPALTFTVCRSTTKDGGALTFPTAQEVEFVIGTTGGKKLWTWSTGQRFRATRHVLYRGSSQCFDWTTRWDWRDDSGRDVPRGQLRLTAWSTAQELRHSPVHVDFSD